MALKSFVKYSADSDFPIQNLPFGIVSTKQRPYPHAASIIGDFVIDLEEIARAGLFDGPKLRDVASEVFSKPNLNDFMALGREAWREARSTLQRLFAEHSTTIRDSPTLRQKILVPVEATTSHLPFAVSDFSDFSLSMHHMTTMGKIFGAPKLHPNAEDLPVAYHGRSSTVSITGTDVVRPWGLFRRANEAKTTLGPSEMVDFELEIGYIVGTGQKSWVAPANADEHIFGVVILNDWSARDIQGWESVPLGPFLGKSFLSSVSPWIVSLDALAPFSVEPTMRAPQPAPYLRDSSYSAANSGWYDVRLSVELTPAGHTEPLTIAKSNTKDLYWNGRHMLAHQTVNGCSTRPGDLLGTGTVTSGEDPSVCGCMCEMTWRGTKPVPIGQTGLTRAFLQDGDEVVFRGWAQGEGYRVGFGTCRGKVVPAVEPKWK
ncbi:Fumarylacetoacetase [Gonapodya prolifera JEL478]|uniref:Fumarylacetoacetase n=1 Tax=Gonapodya prolifera (strain JEL478) TaxID=1344416 RepID=A0A138ZYE2_GONPJ|nr:Fumarylacetoacetase [Gonapodya prolifera JEL478]|eukprot:KXS09514.1 Fumarylacetoacetase [Gonapodya prolifera JEL478]